MAGRPSKYNDDTVKKAKEYLEGIEKSDEAVPTVAGLSLALDVCRDTVYDWAGQEDKAEFSYIVKRLLAKQELMLASKGLEGDFNASMAKLMLSKHGYSEKQDVNLGNQGDQPFKTDTKITVEFVDASPDK